ncbi:hypothetical protein GUJ93_ZPchr0012g21775 [Zizania palustris]|uniref:Uncharacterized protein n=1 Tax=Zizania palustris TaxID=103762 RepID=A0A8J5WVE8_ZIZPA|nr:hypothetical protein GUJ93_ZPchr0012g21775 [Zizania palustris]
MAHQLLRDAQVDLPRETGEINSARDTGGWGGRFLFFLLLVIFLASVHQAAVGVATLLRLQCSGSQRVATGEKIAGTRRQENREPQAFSSLLPSVAATPRFLEIR